jgi:RNA polymerase sigma-70 factor (ECF subfamily)
MRAEATADLITRARSDPAAFGELYDQYLPRVYAFCRRYSSSQQEAEDLTAVTFERALRAIVRYEDRGHPFSSWLLRIAGNAVVDNSRRPRQQVIRPLDLARLKEDGFIQEWEETFWIREHVAALPGDQQEVLRLRYFEDHPFAEVAVRMGRSEGAVKQLLRRALRALHVRMQQEGAERE